MRVNNYVPSEEVFQTNSTSGVNAKEKTTGIESFSNILSSSLDKVNDSQIVSENMNAAFVAGDDVQISDVMLAVEEEKISLQFAVQVRNKLIDAYKELTNMQL